VAIAVIAVAILVSLAGVSGLRVTQEPSGGDTRAVSDNDPAAPGPHPTGSNGPTGAIGSPGSTGPTGATEPAGGEPTTTTVFSETPVEPNISEPSAPGPVVARSPRGRAGPPSPPVTAPARHRSGLRPDCSKAVVDLDFDRYAGGTTTVKVGLHADGFGTDFWKGRGTLWAFLHQEGVGWFPTPQPVQRRGGQWLSENLTFGRDRTSFPGDADNVQRQVYLTLADASAVTAIRDFVRTRFGEPMEGLPVGARPVAEVDTIRIC
jgi:hypothetical protein